MLFVICCLIAIGSFYIGICDAITQYRKPITFTDNPFWTKFWKIVFAISKFLWIIFWGLWWIVILFITFGVNFRRKK